VNRVLDFSCLARLILLSRQDGFWSHLFSIIPNVHTTHDLYCGDQLLFLIGTEFNVNKVFMGSVFGVSSLVS
jgi:hypothetical protein